MNADNLGDVIQNLIDVLRFILRTNRSPLIYANRPVKIAERQTAQTGTEIRNTAQAEGGGQCSVTCVGLKILGCNPVVAETKFIGESGSKDVSFTQHKVFGQIRVALTTEATTVENGPKGKSVRDDLVRVTVADISLVLLACVPVKPLIPLDRVIRPSYVRTVI